MEHQRAGPGPGWVTLRGDTQASRLARGWQEQEMQEPAWTLDKPSQGRHELPRPPEAWVLEVTLETYECQRHIHRPGRGRVSSRVSVCSGCCNEHHSWALIKSRSLLATVLEAGSQDQGAQSRCLARAPSWFTAAVPSLCPHMAEGARGPCGVPCIRVLIPFIQVPPS